VTIAKQAFVDDLHFRLSEHIVLNDGSEAACWLRTTNLAHDVAISKDPTGQSGRLHHLAFWYGVPQHLMDLAELCVDHDIVVEAGPGKHGISQALFRRRLGRPADSATASSSRRGVPDRGPERSGSSQ